MAGAVENAPVPFGFKNPDGSWPIEGYHIIFNPTFVDMCFPAIMNNADGLTRILRPPLTSGSQGGRIHGADIYLEWSQNAQRVNNIHYPVWYDPNGGVARVTGGGGPNNKCIANNSHDWAQWSKAINSIQTTTDSKGRNLCMNILDTEGFFTHTRMLEKCQVIVLLMGDNGNTLGFVCITDLRMMVQERLFDVDSDVAHYHLDDEGDEVLHGENYLYIDGLCSNQRGVGVAMMDKVIELTYNAQNIYQGVKLSSLPYVLKYYWNKFCFRLRPGCFDCNNNPSQGINLDIKNAREFLPLLFPNNNEGKKYLYLNTLVDKLPNAPKGVDEDGRKFRTWTDETMLADPKYSEFLMLLGPKHFNPGVIQPAGAPSDRQSGKKGKKPPLRARKPPPRFGNPSNPIQDRIESQNLFVFGTTQPKLPDRRIQEILDAVFHADKDGTTPVGEGVYMYLCFNTVQKPHVSMTLGYPCTNPSPYTQFLLDLSSRRTNYDKIWMKRKKATKYSSTGGRKRKTKKKRKKSKKKGKRRSRRKRKRTRRIYRRKRKTAGMKKTQPVTADEQEQNDRRERREELRAQMSTRALQAKLKEETKQEKKNRRERLKNMSVYRQPAPVAPQQDDVLMVATRRAQSPSIEDLKMDNLVASLKATKSVGGKKRRTRRKRIR